MSRILLVEDDLRLRQDIQELLEKQGYTVVTVEGYQAALQMVLNREPVDLYLVDVMLPDGDGFALCGKIRERDGSPLLFLTACSDEESIVRGLNLGADDYVTKPFRTRELLSRIQANLRRTMVRHDGCLYSGELVLDRDAQTVYRGGEPLKLSKTEYRLMVFLMENPGIVLKRELILQHIWDGEGRFVEDNTLSVVMSRLRRKVGEYQGSPYWEVVWGIGYRYLLQVQAGVMEGNVQKHPS